MEFKVKIHSVDYETEDAITIRFEASPAFEGYTPGQFINIFKVHRGKMLSRSYSFSSSPEADELPAITIKKMAGGRLSVDLIATVKKGSLLKISEPMGKFSLKNHNLDDKHLIMIAGGSGISPLFALLKSALYKSEKVKITLIYANKSEKSIIFQESLKALQKLHEERLNIYHFLEEYSIQSNFAYHHGYISKAIVEQVLYSEISRTPEVYLCGPEAMMKAMLAHLQELNFRKDHIYTESFASFSLKVNAVSKNASGKAEITFLKGEHAFKIQLSQDKYILQEALQQGLPLPYSCQEAMCGSCKIKLLLGKVNMVENYALTDKQLQEGYVLLCSSKAETKKITLSYQ
ncbi:iron-sulfur cluster-binding domain-containing protein [Catalinimonas sp. 4WD22]|jgi:ring-1,2-phenylacetyl-CoA epoxidase subunit PaaE|uniref:flavin reductase family protein n=1 Tax=Catalinimonas locisalis TaxID=3133978 RepID=UPI0031011650